MWEFKTVNAPRRLSWRIVAALVLVAWLAGSYQVTLRDSSGWCVHFTRFMVCSTDAATDYVFAAQ